MDTLKVFLSIVFIFIISVASVASGQGLDIRPLDLDGTEWNVTLTPDQGGNAEDDKLSFSDRKFISNNFSQQKYEPTNYTLSLKDDGSTLFETMQTKENDVVFWHAMVQNDSMRGIVSVRSARGQVKDYSLSGTLASGVLRPQEPPQPGQKIVVAPEPVEN